VASSSLPLVMDQAQAGAIGARFAAGCLGDARDGEVRPAAIGQLRSIPPTKCCWMRGGRSHRLRVTQIDDTAARAIEAVATDPSLYDFLRRTGLRATSCAKPQCAGPSAAVLSRSALESWTDRAPAAPFIGAYADPWPGTVCGAAQRHRCQFRAGCNLDPALRLRGHHRRFLVRPAPGAGTW